MGGASDLIFKFDWDEGEFIQESLITDPAQSDLYILNPSGIVAHGDVLYISDRHESQNHIITYDIPNQTRSIFADSTGAEISFNGPQGLALSEDGNTLYIGEVTSPAIKAFVTNGEQQGTFTNLVSSTTLCSGNNFIAPQDIAIDTTGNRLFVAANASGTAYVFQISLGDNSCSTVFSESTIGTEVPAFQSVVHDAVNNQLLIADSGQEEIFAVSLAGENMGTKTVLAESGAQQGHMFDRIRRMELIPGNILMVLVYHPNYSSVLSLNLNDGNITPVGLTFSR